MVCALNSKKNNTWQREQREDLSLQYLRQVLLQYIEIMAKEENLNKSFFKIEMVLLKSLPMFIAVMYFSNTVLSYCGIDYAAITYLAGVGFIPLSFLYITSYCFKFCSYHRMPLHYILINNVVCIIDYNWEIPLDDLKYLCLHIIIAFICMIITIYLKFKVCKH